MCIVIHNWMFSRNYTRGLLHTWKSNTSESKWMALLCTVCVCGSVSNDPHLFTHITTFSLFVLRSNTDESYVRPVLLSFARSQMDGCTSVSFTRPDLSKPVLQRFQKLLHLSYTCLAPGTCSLSHTLDMRG